MKIPQYSQNSCVGVFFYQSCTPSGLWKHKCFPGNFANFRRTTFLQNTFDGYFCIPPEITRKSKVFWWFQKVQHGIIGHKWLKKSILQNKKLCKWRHYKNYVNKIKRKSVLFLWHLYFICTTVEKRLHKIHETK